MYQYLKRQVDYLFYDQYEFAGNDIKAAIDTAFDRIDFCFRHITLPNYRDENKKPVFNHLHGDQYSQFLYYFMNSLWRQSQNKPICDKIIQLNRCLHGSFFTYNAGLPDVFAWVHPVGTVLGNDEYENYFTCVQNCTVATRKNRGQDNTTPKLGKGMYLAAGAKILDYENDIGNRVMLGSDAVIFRPGGGIKNDSLVIRDKMGEITIKDHSKERYYDKMKLIFDEEMMKKEIKD